MQSETPKHGTYIEGLRKTVNERFQVLAGNCDLAEAQVICLAIPHYPPHEQLASTFLSLNVGNDDIVLVEGLDSDQGEFLGREITGFRLPSRATVKGWDNMVAHGIQFDLYKQLHDLGYVTKALNAADDPLLTATSEALNTIVAQIAQMRRTRNISMEATIANYPTKRRIVIAGDAHFRLDPELLQALGNEKFIVLTPIEEIPEDAKEAIAESRF